MKTLKKKILIACDSFKGYFTSEEANSIIKKEIEDRGNYEVYTIALGDGGEGTLSALENIIDANAIEIETYNALMKNITAKVLVDGTNGYIEVANIIGITMTPISMFEKTTTYGVGIVIKKMYELGVRNFTICLGGTSTNDLGLGILEAMGGSIYFDDCLIENVTSSNLNHIVNINLNNIIQRYKDISFTLLCDVKNPTYGENGCTMIYAKQKGAKVEKLKQYDESVKNAVNKLNDVTNKNTAFLEGSGAAGGIACMLMSLFNTSIESGIEYMLNVANFSSLVIESDIVITGEGSIDEQSLSGKFITGILDLAKKSEKDCYAIGGIVIANKSNLINQGWKDIVNTCDFHDENIDLHEDKIERLQEATRYLIKEWDYDKYI